MLLVPSPSGPSFGKFISALSPAGRFARFEAAYYSVEAYSVGVTFFLRGYFFLIRFGFSGLILSVTGLSVSLLLPSSTVESSLPTGLSAYCSGFDFFSLGSLGTFSFGGCFSYGFNTSYS